MPDGKEWSWLARVEWGTLLTTCAGGLSVAWRWAVGRRRREERMELERDQREARLDDSRIGTLDKSWKLQRDLLAYLDSRIERLTAEAIDRLTEVEKYRNEVAGLRIEIAALRAEHEACERSTERLTKQNREQAGQIAELQTQLAKLKAERI